MTATPNSINPKRAKVEIGITTEMVAALPTLTTVETIDISSIVKNVSVPTDPERTVTEDFVVGDDNAIEDYDDHIGGYETAVDYLYTNGKDQLGTDQLDFHQDILDPLFKYTGSPPLSMPITVSLAGGNPGDSQWATSAARTRLKKAPPPVGGVDTGGKVRCSATFYTPTLDYATIL